MAPASHHAPFNPDAPRRRDVTFTVRAAHSGDHHDAQAAARLVTSVYGGELATWRDRMVRSSQRPGSLFAVAEVDGRIVGYGKAAHCTPVDDADRAPASHYLTGLVVAPAWRRGGIGEALTRWRVHRVLAGQEPVYFFTNAHNTNSIALHARLGFVEIGRASSYLGEPFKGGEGVLMQCTATAWQDQHQEPLLTS